MIFVSIDLYHVFTDIYNNSIKSWYNIGMTQQTHAYGVLWDLDGVIVDTGEFHYLSWLQVFKELDLHFDQDIFNRTFGMNNAGILEWVFGYKPDAAQIEQISDRKESVFRQLVSGKAKLLPGISHWLQFFLQNGAKQAIASSAPVENIKVLLQELSISDYFNAVVSGAELPGKPNPDIFLKAAAAIGIPADKCIVVEDAIAGVEGAKRAGMKCIAVTTTNPSENLSQADLIFDNLGEMDEQHFLSLVR